jgi:hypothetical protein
VCAARRPSHLLLLHESLRNELIDRRFDKSGRDAYATSAPLPVVNDRSGVIVDVGAEFAQCARKLGDAPSLKNPPIGCSGYLIAPKTSCPARIGVSTRPPVIYVILPGTFARTNPE